MKEALKRARTWHSVGSMEHFRLPAWPWVWCLGGLVALPAVPRLYAYELMLAIPDLVLAAFLVAFALWAGRLSVGPGGITLYRIYRMRWDDAKSARLATVAELQYLHVKRHRGLSLWIPLYLIGLRDVRTALRDQAPSDNPIRKCLEAA